MFMDTAAGVFLVLCNLEDQPDLQYDQLRYWLRFIASKAQPEARPRVALVGTHRSTAGSLQKRLKLSPNLPEHERVDLVNRIARLEKIKRVGDAWVCDEISGNVAKLVGEFRDLLDLAPRICFIDSISQYKTDRAEMHRLRAWIRTKCADIRNHRRVPKVCRDVARVIKTVRNKLPVVAPFAGVQAAVKAEVQTAFDLGSEDRFRAVLHHLSRAGHVMYFEDVDDIVVVDPLSFGKRVIGQLFCPSGTVGFNPLLIDRENNLTFRQNLLAEVLKFGGF